MKIRLILKVLLRLSLKNKDKAKLNYLIKILGNRITNTWLHLSRMVYRSPINPEHKFAVTEDKSTIVAWHPKEDFPYECTKPLPEEKLEESSSILKTTLTPEVMEVFNKKTPEQARQELMNITHTTKHRWFPRARDKKAKKTPMDREYL